MGADDDNYGDFGLPFAVFVIAGWASINLALNFVRCPPTQSLPSALHALTCLCLAAVQFIRAAT